LRRLKSCSAVRAGDQVGFARQVSNPIGGPAARAKRRVAHCFRSLYRGQSVRLQPTELCVSNEYPTRLDDRKNLPNCIYSDSSAPPDARLFPMKRQEIKRLVDAKIRDEGRVETGVKGVELFRVTTALRCAPAVYEPMIIAILSGEKEAILAGEKHTYDASHYMCCTMSMPVEAGTPKASPNNPLLGVQISLDRSVLTKLAIEMESAPGAIRPAKGRTPPKALTLAPWDDAFTDALLRLLQLNESPGDTAVLGEGRLRELYFAVLKGGAGDAARRAFGVGNEVARAIEYLSSHLDGTVTIEEMAAQVGMSRAVFHR